jgi:hypothetical protein
MRQKLFIILGLAVLIIILVGLNAISYTQKEKELDTETNPNRSTYNLGATGTRAFFDLLAETGRKPVRWQGTPAELLLNNKNKPATFVIIGTTRKDVTPEEATQILQWVSEGGRLVVVDRDPADELVKTTADWKISFSAASASPYYTVDSSDQKAMTGKMKAARPVQPTVYTKGLNGVQPSMFATSVNFEYLSVEEFEKKSSRRLSQPTPFSNFSKPTPKPEASLKAAPSATPKPADGDGRGRGEGTGIGRAPGSGVTEPKLVVKTPTPGPVVKKESTFKESDEYSDEDYEPAEPSAPVVHLNADGRNLLVDVPYGAGRIVFLTDPYIVANGGINLVDNAQLAINVVAAGGGIIAFDEFHQGYGANTNRFFQFFADTPVIPIFLQIALLVGLLFFSQSRRFARAVPEAEPSRLSKLEYVSAMAELQQRIKGYDLAVENIYTDFRRRVSRLVGVDALKTRRQDLALLIVERLPDENPGELEQLMARCEDVMHGDPTNKKEVVRLTARLRELEEKLGLQRRKRQRKAV